MKVGEYIRTPKGIGRINQMYSDRKDSYIYLDCGITIDYITKDFTEEEINKMYPSSPNIIDLIEVGDYVNGSRVEEIEEYNGEKYLYLEEMEYSNANQDYINVYCKQEYIESIVTKEMYSNVEYRVENN